MVGKGLIYPTHSVTVTPQHNNNNNNNVVVVVLVVVSVVVTASVATDDQGETLFVPQPPAPLGFLERGPACSTKPAVALLQVLSLAQRRLRWAVRDVAPAGHLGA